MQKIRAPLKFIEPMECREVQQLPEGEDWQYELKFDGYRALAIKQRGEVHLFSRNGKSFNDLFPDIAAKVAALQPKAFILDGEIVAIDEQGRHSFALLQNIRKHRGPVHFYAFDLLHLDRKDLRHKPLCERRALLEKHFAKTSSFFRLSPIFGENRDIILAKIREFEFEGAVAKRRDSIYESGKATGAWLKHKTQRSDDFVVGGYIPGAHGVGELVVGRWEGERLLYVETVRNGFVPATRREVFKRIETLHIEECPFANLPEKKGAHAMVAFNEMTVHGRLRLSRYDPAKLATLSGHRVVAFRSD